MCEVNWPYRIDVLARHITDPFGVEARTARNTATEQQLDTAITASIKIQKATRAGADTVSLSGDEADALIAGGLFPAFALTEAMEF